MPIRTGEAAPYAPPATVLHVVTALRDRGLSTPITADVLLRAGISESLVPRTLRSLVGLEFIDEDGRLTPAMEALRRAPSTEFRERLAEHVRAVYEEVFRFTDPASDDMKRIADAFRVYEPIGQRGRMVTLFLGLCEAAGLIPESIARKQVSVSGGSKKSPTKPNAAKRPTDSARASGSAHVSAVTGADPFLVAALQKLPPNGTGWTRQERDGWIGFFTNALDYVIPVREAARDPNADDIDEAEEE